MRTPGDFPENKLLFDVNSSNFTRLLNHTFRLLIDADKLQGNDSEHRCDY